MGYHVLDPEALPETDDYPCDRRGLADAAGLTNLAAAVYTMTPGEQLPRTYHYHEQREELFLVLSGQLSVETPDREYEVPTGSVFVAEPESPHRAYNPEDASEAVRVVGIGAPSYDPAHPYEPRGDKQGTGQE